MDITPMAVAAVAATALAATARPRPKVVPAPADRKSKRAALRKAGVQKGALRHGGVLRCR